MVVAMFIPTVVHVYLFTLLFMVYGAMNEKSAYAWLGIVLLVLSPFVIILLPLDAEKYLISNHVKSTFMYNNFNRVKNSIAGILQLQETNGKFNLVSVAGIKLQVFLAFAYTYHYLNWFSKTSIIGWGKNIQAKKWVVIIVLWALSVGLYYYDYRTGLLALFFLSLLHVFLEFPLNIISVKGIFAKLFMKKGIYKLKPSFFISARSCFVAGFFKSAICFIHAYGTVVMAFAVKRFYHFASIGIIYFYPGIHFP